jgi:hypothetical protein
MSTLLPVLPYQGTAVLQFHTETSSHLLKQSCMFMILLENIDENDIPQVFCDCALMLVEHLHVFFLILTIFFLFTTSFLLSNIVPVISNLWTLCLFETYLKPSCILKLNNTSSRIKLFTKDMHCSIVYTTFSTSS